MSLRPKQSLKAFGLAGLLLVVSQGCGQIMSNQPRVDTMEPSPFEFATIGNRTPVPGTISRSKNLDQSPTQTGLDEHGPVAQIPVPVTEELLARGRERYNIFCQHCHGMTGQADGMVVKRGFPAPPNYSEARLQNASDGQLFLTIRDGVSRMPAFGARIPVEDRWAIVAYIRALQLSQDVPVGSLTDEERQNLK
jgi:mono/diheme cytochrome c family protein